MPINPTTRYLGKGSAILEWTSDDPNVHGWKVARDGVDSKGTPAWQSPILPAHIRSYTFNLLKPGNTYNLSLIAVYASFASKVTITDDVPEIPVPPVTPPTTPPTNPPQTGDGTTAATTFNWGKPDPSSDEFNYVGLPDSNKWGIYGKGGSVGGDGKECWEGHAGNGRRCVYTNYVNGEYLRQTGFSGGDSAGISHRLNQKYGRWEIRARIIAGPGSGRPYHPVLITWPQSEQWPQGGEYDFLEVNVGDKDAGAFMHYPTQSGVVQDYHKLSNVDLSQWHNWGFEWNSKALIGYCDGQEWFRTTNSKAQAPGPMHLTIQLDNFFKNQTMREGYFDISWARVYRMP